MAEKYLVLRTEDLRQLSKEQQESLLGLITSINSFRTQNNKRIGDEFAVFSLNDQFTQGALEGYLNAAQSDRDAMANKGVQDAVNWARDKRSRMMLVGLNNLPT